MSVISDGTNKECFYSNDINQLDSIVKDKDYSWVHEWECSRTREIDNIKDHWLSEGV